MVIQQIAKLKFLGSTLQRFDALVSDAIRFVQQHQCALASQ